MASSSPERKGKQVETRTVPSVSKIQAVYNSLPSVNFGYRSVMALCMICGLLAAIVAVAGGDAGVSVGMAAVNRGGAGREKMRVQQSMSTRSAPAAAPMPMMASADFASDSYAGNTASFKAERSSMGRGGGAMSGVVSAMQIAGDEAGSPDGTVLQGPVVLKSASMNLETKDVAAAMQAVQSSVEKVGGYIESAGSNTDEWLLGRYRAVGAEPPVGPTSGHMQARVPAAKLDAARAAILSYCPGTPCRVTGENSHGQDVSESYVDAVTRQRVDEKALAQLGELLKAADTVNDVLAVKREMDGVVSRLESTKAQRKSMESRATMSTLTLSYSVPQPPTQQPPQPQGWSWAQAWSNAVAALGKAAQGTATVGVYTAVFSLPLCVVGAVLVFLGRRCGMGLGRAKGATGTVQGGSAGEGYAPLR